MNIKHLAQGLAPSDHSINESYYGSVAWLEYRWSVPLNNAIFPTGSKAKMYCIYSALLGNIHLLSNLKNEAEND